MFAPVRIHVPAPFLVKAKAAAEPLVIDPLMVLAPMLEPVKVSVVVLVVVAEVTGPAKFRVFVGSALLF